MITRAHAKLKGHFEKNFLAILKIDTWHRNLHILRLRTLPKMIAFLEEKLSDAEMEQVEQMIEEDELYAFALERLHQAMLKGENVEAIASQFQEVFVKKIQEEAKPEAKKISFPVWRIVSAAAVVNYFGAYLHSSR